MELASRGTLGSGRDGGGIVEGVSMAQDRVAIVGAGLAVCLLTLALEQSVYGVDVYERHADPCKNPANLGRSINLGLSRRGMQALRVVGLLETALQRSVIMQGRVIHAPDGST